MDILVVEDDSDIRTLIMFHLKNAGFHADEAEDGTVALDRLRHNRYGLVILDIMLPGLNGIDLLKYIRYESGQKKLPVIITSAMTEDIDIITALELGADDYITKPFSPKVLLAKIRSVLRRIDSTKPRAMKISGMGITLDLEKRLCESDGVPVPLKATEFDLLFTLMETPEKVFTRKEMIESVRGQDYSVTERAIDVQVTSIRKKLGGKSRCLETVWGIGYRWTEQRA